MFLCHCQCLGSVLLQLDLFQRTSWNNQFDIVSFGLVKFDLFGDVCTLGVSLSLIVILCVSVSHYSITFIRHMIYIIVSVIIIYHV